MAAVANAGCVIQSRGRCSRRRQRDALGCNEHVAAPVIRLSARRPCADQCHSDRTTSRQLLQNAFGRETDWIWRDDHSSSFWGTRGLLRNSVSHSWRTAAKGPRRDSSVRLPRVGSVVCSSLPESKSRQKATILVSKTLKEQGAWPRKGLGQHFLIDEELNAKIVRAANIVPGDVVLEVGPGTGALTRRLLEAGALVLAVEKDAKMYAALTASFADVPEVEIVHGDILRWDIGGHVSKVLSALGNPRRAKIVSNLPFNITSEFLAAVVRMGDIFSTIVLLVQEETARRLIHAGPGDGGLYRYASVMLRFFGEAKYVFGVGRKSFYPQPKVDAAVIRVELRTSSEYPLLESSHSSYASTLKAFSVMVASAFQGKRKMLRNSLKALYGTDAVLAALDIRQLSSEARPEELALEDFTSVFNSLEKTRNVQERAGAELVTKTDRGTENGKPK